MDRSGVSAYNDEHTHWPWFVQFLGGAVFFGNEWPPLRARLIVDDRAHPVTKHLAATLSSPDNEWYIWKPSPRLNKDVQVLLTLRSEEHTSELQSLTNLVCRLLL